MKLHSLHLSGEGQGMGASNAKRQTTNHKPQTTNNKQQTTNPAKRQPQTIIAYICHLSMYQFFVFKN
jgi:hypothetical protein